MSDFPTLRINARIFGGIYGRCEVIPGTDIDAWMCLYCVPGAA